MVPIAVEVDEPPGSFNYRVSVYVDMKQLIQAVRPQDVVEDVIRKCTDQLAHELVVAIAAMPDIQLLVRQEVKLQVKDAVRKRLDEIVDDLVENL